MFNKLKKMYDDAKMHYGIGLNLAFEKFNHQLNSLFIDREYFDDDFFEDLEEKLIELDILPTLALVLVNDIQNKIYNQKISREAFDDALYEVIEEKVNLKQNNEFILEKDKKNILLIVGINGVGKTTTISKLTNLYKKNHNILLVAADTFRAGAIDQLATWADRLDVDIVKTHQGHAPSAVIYEGMTTAKNDNKDLIICDTAGRLHNKENLMNELSKIHGVITKNIEEEYNLKSILVLDGTQGKNTIEQARAFNEITKLDGIIVTKMDSNAKVGMLINISYELNLPIYFITNGEQIEDIKTFDSDMYLSMLFNEEK